MTSLTESTSVSSPAAVVERVLIVEDELAARSGLEQLVRSWGFVAESASDGREALEKVTTFRPAIVITDLVMPGMDGLELLRALNQQGADVTTLLLTAQGTVETAVEAMKEGRVRLPHQADRDSSASRFFWTRSSSGSKRSVRSRRFVVSCASTARSGR